MELKKRATKAQAQSIFAKLKDCLEILDYLLAVFVHIDSTESFGELVDNDRVHVLNVLSATLRTSHELEDSAAFACGFTED